MRRLGILIALVFIGFGIAASTAAGITYYGYNYLGPTVPNDQCAPYQGRACSGFNEWVYSIVDKNSGDCINIGFQGVGEEFQDYASACSFFNGSTVTVDKWSVGANGYNRAVCRYDGPGSSSYVRCRVTT